METWEKIAVGAVVLTTSVLVTALTLELRAERLCLLAGYPSVSLDFTLSAYCIKRLDQTDIVVPLQEAVKK